MRYKEIYVSLLRPPVIEGSTAAESIDKVEWKQVFDILWSDPQCIGGCVANALRGAGTYFGPDVTASSFLQKNKLSFIIRSHECKPGGYEIMHGGNVITIFSASNYYELGSNKGAYLKLCGNSLERQFVQYTAAVSRTRRLTFRQRVGLVESSAMRELHNQIMMARRSLEATFRSLDSEQSGFISISDWCQAMEETTHLGLPWRMLKDKLVRTDPETRKVRYMDTFELNTNRNGRKSDTLTVVETLYKNQRSLEAIFKILDKDNSGYITLEEFSEACQLIGKYMPNPMTQEQLVDICRLMDINKDGLVDLNEFLESFRLAEKSLHEQERMYEDMQAT
uniref:EF-hand domain-containing protein n=1 Tax=Bombyx mori TaxID=7091 RepID=A0A8R2M8W8_BOMMO|nr:serine/threonine-protein phosphatase rdgC-like [Bombyx mori]